MMIIYIECCYLYRVTFEKTMTTPCRSIMDIHTCVHVFFHLLLSLIRVDPPIDPPMISPRNDMEPTLRIHDVSIERGRQNFT